jgi:phospholipid N-methyltransferase
VATASPGHAQVLRPLAHYWKFLVAGLVEQGQTGALLPSQRFLVERMISPVPKDYRGLIVELGAGTGSLTNRLAVRCPKARIVACEINPQLARLLEADLASKGLDTRVRVFADAAEEYLDQLAPAPDKPSFVISGIPLGNLPGPVVVRLVGAIRAALPTGGMYIQFQHSLIDRKRIMAAFASVRTVPVLLNVPPAFVYYARK